MLQHVLQAVPLPLHVRPRCHQKVSQKIVPRQQSHQLVSQKTVPWQQSHQLVSLEDPGHQLVLQVLLHQDHQHQICRHPHDQDQIILHHLPPDLVQVQDHTVVPEEVEAEGDKLMF